MWSMKFRTWSVATLIALTVIGAACATVAFAFSGRVPLRMEAGGEPLDEQTVESAFAATTVTVRDGSNGHVLHLDESGFVLDVEATMEAAKSSGAVDRLSCALSSCPAPVVWKVDHAALERAATSVGLRAPKDATVVRDGLRFAVEPGEDGEMFGPRTMAAFTSAAASLESGSVELDRATAAPAVSVSEAQAVADRANARLDTTVNVSGAEPDDATRSSWIGTDASVDLAKVTEWVESVANDQSSTPVNGVRNVEGDTVRVVIVQAKDGRHATDAKDVAKKVAEDLRENRDSVHDLTWATDAAKWTQRPVASGAEHMAYPAAEGEKWVDVNLSTFTVTPYVGATRAHDPIPMVPGAPATPTAQGLFHVYLQYESQTMRGENADGSRYVTPGVPWVTYFTGSYALHGAPWRSSFGWGGAAGSHGCVNMPVAGAKWVYDWVTIGTPVAVHS